MKIRAQGWLQGFLQTQMEGLTGHIEEAGFPFDRTWWGTEAAADGEEHPNWWEYEQTAYWLDGYTRCALLLNRKKDIERASQIIYSVLDHPDEEGYLGPQFMKNIPWGRWPHVVFFRACLVLWEYNRDPKILQALTRHYVGHTADYTRFRDVLNVEIMVLLYLQSKDERLLDLACESYKKYNDVCEDDNCDRVALSDKKPYAHGVTYNEYAKLGALLYTATNDEAYLRASVAAFAKIDKFFMLPGGCPCSDEFLLSDYFMESYETCDISDYTWALYYMQTATDQGAYGDKIERCIFNAGLGSVLEDFKALQYFSCANQLIADGTSNHNSFFAGKEWMSYRPDPGTQCWPGNVNRFMPNYVWNMWQCDGNTVTCRLFGPSRYECEVDGNAVTVDERTHYPFEESITFTVTTNASFTLRFRVPAWSTSLRVTVNGSAVQLYPLNGYVQLPVDGNTQIIVSLTSDVQKHFTHGGVYFTKGALVYALGGKERRIAQKQTGKSFPTYDMYADFEWRYAVDENAEAEFGAGRGDDTFERSSLPHLTLWAQRIDNWDFDRPKIVQRCTDLYIKQYTYEKGDFVFTPRYLPAVPKDGKKEKIVLYPYGVQKMRLTVFPCNRK